MVFFGISFRVTSCSFVIVKVRAVSNAHNVLFFTEI